MATEYQFSEGISVSEKLILLLVHVLDLFLKMLYRWIYKMEFVIRNDYFLCLMKEQDYINKAYL